ncbi:MAG TPA: hypothetical protein VK492_15210 [Chitinophagaceae bacterium]|nr:hypothetical protein [Chitinophagaceae bacterium]
MRKLILFLLFVFLIIDSSAQQKYRCEFFDTTISIIPESLVRDIASKNNLSSKQIKQFLEQQKARPAYRYQLRVVRAAEDQTIISLEKRSIRGNHIIQTVGNFTLQPIDSMLYKNFDSILYKNDEIFNEAPTLSGFSEKPWDRRKRDYRGTGKKILILGYQCDEFINIDSTFYMWVTEELPAYVNPGIRTNNVKGAVLGFKYIEKTGTTTKSMLVKLEKVL